MVRVTQQLRPWLEPAPAHSSATVVLLRDDSNGLEALVSQRAAKSSFVPSMYVFPGGRTDAADATWAALWAERVPGLFPAHWPQRLHAQALAAVRECFEEMGVALVYQDGRLLRADALQTLRRDADFYPQLQARGWQPAVPELVWVADRITHASMPKRFHTAFFYAAMPPAQTVAPDLHEQLDAVWLPLQSRAWQDNERLPMIYPTIKTLESLAPFDNTAAALQAARGLHSVPSYFTREVLVQDQVQHLSPEHMAYAECELLAPDGQVFHSLDWQYERPVPLLQHVQRLTCANANMMTGPGTNTYLVGSAEQGFCVIDAGPKHKPHLRHILQSTGGHIAALLCTHSHPDHSPGAVLLQRWLRRQGKSVPLLGMASLPTAAAHSLFRPTHPTAHDASFVLPATAAQPQHTLRFIHTPGHAANHLCILLEEDGLLFSGDHILNGSSTVIAPPDGDMTHYLQSLDLLDQYCQRFDVQFILPAHGYVLGGNGHCAASSALGGGGLRVIEQVRQHRLAREGKVLRAMRSLHINSNTPATRQQVLPLVYDDVPPAIWPVAERSLAAHMARIVEHGLLA